jgi:hypothetical protein
MLTRILEKRKYYGPDISRLNKEIRGINHEIKLLESDLRKMKKPLLPREKRSGRSVFRGEPGKNSSDFETRRRFASYLSTGSFQTIREYKFKSDFVRKRRLLLAGMIILLLAIIFLLFKLL